MSTEPLVIEVQHPSAIRLHVPFLLGRDGEWNPGQCDIDIPEPVTWHECEKHEQPYLILKVQPLKERG